MDRPIIVVDDNMDAALTLAALLQIAGHSVKWETDPFEAYELVCAERPKVVILDISMPGMNGYDLARKLRETPGLEPILLIAVSGHDLPEDRRKSAAAGINFHFAKPADPDALFAVIEGARGTSP